MGSATELTGFAIPGSRSDDFQDSSLSVQVIVGQTLFHKGEQGWVDPAAGDGSVATTHSAVSLIKEHLINSR